VAVKSLHINDATPYNPGAPRRLVPITAIGAYGSPAFAGTTANEAAVTRIQLDTPTPRFVNRTLLASDETAGRIAQRESVPFTRERSKVRSLVRPPAFARVASYGLASHQII
jgi:hypothetical protein